MARVRLDQLLVERGLADSRARAQALIRAGEVFAGGRRLDKPGQLVAGDVSLEIRSQRAHVSRGAIKLEHALRTFPLEAEGVVAVDIGASTGGFTEVLLRHGARRVYAVDVGHGQLDWTLRNDPRVVVLERTNARYLSREQIPEPLDGVVCDASFISLTQVLPASLALTRERAWLVALIKPQFEVGKGRVGKGGVVRDPRSHEEVCEKIRAWLEQQGWGVLGIAESPILGPKGNREFLIAARKPQSGTETRS